MTTSEAQCCMCGKNGLSTTEGDGGTECQLEDGRWTCSEPCFAKAGGYGPECPSNAMRGAVNKTSWKPADIPQDVWETAINATQAFDAPTSQCIQVCEIVARSVVADRASRATPAPEPQPEVAAEPVAWRWTTEDINGDQWPWTYFEGAAKAKARISNGYIVEPLYATPPVVEEAVKADAWQDIATAPKDGTLVDLFGSRNGEPQRFTDARWAAITSWGTGEPTGDFRWMFDAYDVYGEFAFTHWQPLPAPPQAARDVCSPENVPELLAILNSIGGK